VAEAVEALAVGAEAPDAEASLVEAAIRGDARAFAALYDRHVARVYRHVYYRVGRRADAEDITQQVFLQAWRAIGRYRRTGAPFLAWLFVVAQNAVAGFYRRRQPAAELDFEPAVNERWADPEASALGQLDRAAVRRAILRLKPDQQQVVIMRFVEHLEHPAIAAALGKSEGNVRVIQHRALRELRRLLAHQVAG
jgi:RNA polymerase sigma-70 factor (ECF subfamily)